MDFEGHGSDREDDGEWGGPSMTEINADEKVLITYKGKTQVYDGVAVAAVSSLEEEEFNEKTRNAGGRVEATKLDFFLLGAMKKNELVAMESKFLRDTWHMLEDSDKAEIIDTLRRLVAVDEARDTEGKGERNRVQPF